MITVGTYEAKTHLTRLLDQVGQGETVTITKHGVPIALLCPVRMPTRKERADAIAKLLAFQPKQAPNGLTVREMMEEGRR